MSALRRKVETAMAAVIATLADVPVDAEDNPAIVKGADAGDLDRDRVLVECLGGPEEPHGTGNRRMKVRVTVVTGADVLDDDDDPAERHERNCGAVFEGLTGLGPDWALRICPRCFPTRSKNSMCLKKASWKKGKIQISRAAGGRKPGCTRSIVADVTSPSGAVDLPLRVYVECSSHGQGNNLWFYW
jgi:hypothetical protein